MSDNVNNPDHYLLPNGLQAIDLIEALLTPEEFKGFLKGNIHKYNLRADKKGNPEEDRRKAVWYTNYLLEIEAENNRIYSLTPKGKALVDMATAGFDIPLSKHVYVWDNMIGKYWLKLTEEGMWRSEQTGREYSTETVLEEMERNLQSFELRGEDD